MIAPVGVQPIFLFSLPRAGSTLVQRVIGAHPEVHTVSEPWLLLPLVYSLRTRGARAEYWHESTAEALADFCKQLPGGEDDYYAGLREFALRMYGQASPDGQRYFLDKTPHYHLIADEVMRIFPEGRFVFLWRNPLAVLASLIETFRGGRWQPGHFRLDLERGVTGLAAAWQRSDGRAHAVQYEQLVGADSEEEWRRLFAYLDLDFDPQVLAGFGTVRLEGRYGDPTGVRRYAGLSREPLEKWRTTIAGPVRSAWCRGYLRRVGDEPLAVMGYDAAALADGLDADGGHSPLRDAVDTSLARLAQARRDRALRLSETPHPIGDAFRKRPPLPRRVAGLAKRQVLGAVRRG